MEIFFISLWVQCEIDPCRHLQIKILSFQACTFTYTHTLQYICNGEKWNPSLILTAFTKGGVIIHKGWSLGVAGIQGVGQWKCSEAETVPILREAGKTGMALFRREEWEQTRQRATHSQVELNRHFSSACLLTDCCCVPRKVSTFKKGKRTVFSHNTQLVCATHCHKMSLRPRA